MKNFLTLLRKQLLTLEEKGILTLPKKNILDFHKHDLLILGEWLLTVPAENELNFIFFELVEKRSEVHSTVISGLYLPASWCKRMGSSTQSESIVE